MYHRLALVLLISVGSPQLLVAQSDWDCQLGADGKEWVCTTRKKEPEPKSIPPIAPPETNGQQSPTESSLSPKTSPAPPADQPTEWNCAGSERQDWNCTKPDPMSSIQSVNVDKGKEGDDFIPAKPNLAMNVNKNMLARMAYDPWALCTSQLGPAVSPKLGAQRNLAPMHIESDYLDVFEEDILLFSGGVNFKRADQDVSADQTEYDRQSNILNAKGNVYYREEGLSLYSDRIFLKMDSDKAHLTNTQYILETIPARGHADVVYKDSNTLYRFKNASYTTCRPNNQDWVLYANDLKFDRESGRAQALNTVLKVRDIPVLYSPYISFPIDDRRESGFLAPSFGSTDETGFNSTVPYYWNIAPNFDLTFSPRIMSNRGVLLGGEMRYLRHESTTELSAEIVPFDSERKDTRGQASLINETRFSPNIVFDMDANYVSDDDYLDQLGNSLSFSSERHIKSQANLRYGDENTSMLARAEYYQTIDRTIASVNRPYRRLPQLLLDTQKAIGDSGAKIDLRSEFVYFQRGSSVTGPRLNIKPGLSYPVNSPAMFITPKVSLDHTQYWLDDPTNTFSDVSRTLPIASIDGGVFLDRDFTLNSNSYLQTLEPRAFYLYIPDHDQDDIPLFDTSQYDFSYNQLFRENRFNGVDRLGDANQLSFALTSRFVESATGKQRLKATAGQIYYFNDRNVTQNAGANRDDRSTSNLVIELDALLLDSLTFRSGLQWNPDVNDIARGEASIQYRQGLERIVNLSYRYRKNLITDTGIIDQGNISFRWPFLDDVHLVGRWQYSFLDRLTLESFLGFEKEGCCWRLRAVVRRFINDISSEAQTAIFLQIELKGFTSFGDKVDRFLEQNISGFRAP